MREFIKITKSDARKRYNEGKIVRLTSSKMSPNSIWGEASPISKHSGKSFEQVCNEFSYYNCTKETGLRISFYILREEEK